MRPENTTDRVKSYLGKNNVIAPSILSADFSVLGSEIKQVEDAGVDWIHVDVMDGHFVPNITIGPVVVKSIRPKTNSILDCHLMVDHPLKWIKPFSEAGADLITVHLESHDHLTQTIDAIRKENIAVGLSINPDTPAMEMIPYLDQVDLVLIMSVHPGFGGQSFIESSLNKARELKKIQDEKKSFLIEMDGGIGLSNLKRVQDSGVNVFVAGSAIFKTDDRSKTVSEFLKELS